MLVRLPACLCPPLWPTPAQPAAELRSACAGLDEEQLELVANTPGVMKASRRDLPYVLSQVSCAARGVADWQWLATSASQDGVLVHHRRSCEQA